MGNYRPTMKHYTTMDSDKYYELLWWNSGFADVDVKLQKKLDIIRYYAYAKLCTKYQALPVTAAYMAEILGWA